MCWIHFVINISQKCMSSADVWKYRDSVLGHRDCLAANSKSTGPPQKSTDDRNCSIDSTVRPTSAQWQNADVDGQRLLLRVYNCSSSTAEQFHGDIDTWALSATIYLLFHHTRSTEKRRKNDKTKATQTEHQMDYKVWLDSKYRIRLSNSKCNNMEPSEKNKIKAIT